MENQQEKEGYKVSVTYQGKSKAFKVVNPNQNLKITLENIKKLSREYPEDYWHLPEINNGGQRITYLLGRIDSSGKKEVFHEKNKNGELQCLTDYDVKDGDQLIIIHKVIAG